jgi:hypothetical protein
MTIQKVDPEYLTGSRIRGTDRKPTKEYPTGSLPRLPDRKLTRSTHHKADQEYLITRMAYLAGSLVLSGMV